MDAVSDPPAQTAAADIEAEAITPVDAISDPPVQLPKEDISGDVIARQELEPDVAVDTVSSVPEEATGADICESAPDTAPTANMVSVNVAVAVPVTVSLSLERGSSQEQGAVLTPVDPLEPCLEPSAPEHTGCLDEKTHTNITPIIPIGITPPPAVALVPPLGEDSVPPIDNEIGGSMHTEQTRMEASPDPCNPEPEGCPSCDAVPPKAPEEKTGNPAKEGLLHYKKWWYRRDVDVVVRGEKLSGTPIFIHNNTIRLVNPSYSYFIPLSHIDYIRTNDGSGK
ncbi:MAG: hypothetical protein LIO58_00325 [Oscillospiraceae bacterium]|nr:hypothetical protein [Oscillospiraceae bacterium]